MFCFHNVVDSSEVGAGDASLHMGRDEFERTIDWAQHAYTIVGLEQLRDRLRSGRSTAGLAALTFDDAYEGFMRHGVPLLARYDLPATVFVVPEAAEAPSPFWWDVLGASGRLSDEVRGECLTDYRGVAGEVLEGTSQHRAGPGILPSTYLPATWGRVSEATQAWDGLSIGSHTLSHPNLVRASPSELERELTASRMALSDRLGILPRTISYPYGMHDARVREKALASGYGLGLSLDRGLVTSNADPLAIPRLNVPAGAGLDALECWAAGLRPR